jgi:hypothetical protein
LLDRVGARKVRVGASRIAIQITVGSILTMRHIVCCSVSDKTGSNINKNIVGSFNIDLGVSLLLIQKLKIIKMF